MEAIFNVPYRPEFNSIEEVWAMAKKVFREKVTRQMIEQTKETLREQVISSLIGLEKKKVINCCLSGTRRILEATEEQIRSAE